MAGWFIVQLGFNDAKAVLKTLDENFLCHNYSEQQQQQPGLKDIVFILPVIN